MWRSTFWPVTDSNKDIPGGKSITSTAVTFCVILSRTFAIYGLFGIFVRFGRISQGSAFVFLNGGRSGWL